jgi:hypothetical protein
MTHLSLEATLRFLFNEKSSMSSNFCNRCHGGRSRNRWSGYLCFVVIAFIWMIGQYDEWVQVPPRKNLSPALSSIVNVKSSHIQDGTGNRLSLQLLAKENVHAKEKF